MVAPKHLELLEKGIEFWNQWRQSHPDIQPHLEGASLEHADLCGADLRGANLVDSRLMHAKLRRAKLHRADLRGADMRDADLEEAKLHHADLRGAHIKRTSLRRADFTGADLRYAVVVLSDARESVLIDCRIHGASAWDLNLAGARQSNLIVTTDDQPVITVDDFEIGQFIYLLLNNESIRKAIDEITSKVVLILGRFKTERKAVLDAIREHLRERDYVPVLFDFDKPASKDLTGTVETLARLARFIIADLTDPASIPHELATLAPHLRRTPIRPLLLAGSPKYALFDDLSSYPWVLATYEYTGADALVASLSDVITPAEDKARELRGERG